MVRVVRVARILALILLMLSIADWWLTRLALQLGAVEANPLLEGIVASPVRFFILKVLLVAVLAGIAGLVVRSERALGFLTGVVVVYVFVVGWNVATLQTLV
ncbi:MAG: hypothetical protein BMS9Abin07_0154 [Acidimicrobiia bacterium]|nr:MAG: hypothetical protein BMS9Abin07_0154 [Acidimicrobiia bacterium]